MNKKQAILALILALCAIVLPNAQEKSSEIDSEALIRQIVQVDADQQATLKDVVFDAEYVEGESKEDGSFEEKMRFMKRISIKYFPDTAWFHEQYVQYYEEGKLQSDDDCRKAAKERLEKNGVGAQWISHFR